MLTYTKEEIESGRYPQGPPSEIDPATTKRILGRLDKPDGGAVEFDMLRSLDWIEDYGAHPGGRIFLNMKEMGVVGSADVLAIEPCPKIQPGPGRITTGKFKHTAGEVYDLHVAAEHKLLTGTGVGSLRRRIRLGCRR